MKEVLVREEYGPVLVVKQLGLQVWEGAAVVAQARVAARRLLGRAGSLPGQIQRRH
jgi:hypothetical protein